MSDHRREPDWADRALGTIMWGFFLALLLLLAPGIIFDWLFNRFAGSRDDLFSAAVKDGGTWLFSFLFWIGIGTLVFVLYRRFGKQGPSSAEDPIYSTDTQADGGTWEESDFHADGEPVYEEASPPPPDDGLGILCTDAACAEALGIDTTHDFTMDTVRTAYRVKIASYHPDKVAHLGPKLREVAELESKRLNLAYQYFEERYQDA